MHRRHRGLKGCECLECCCCCLAKDGHEISMKGPLIFVCIGFAFILGWLLGGAVQEPGPVGAMNEPGNTAASLEPAPAPLRRFAIVDESAAAEPPVPVKLLPASPGQDQNPMHDTGVLFAENMLRQMDTPEGWKQHYRDDVSLEEVVRSPEVNPEGLDIDEAQRRELEQLLRAHNDRIAHANRDMTLLRWRSAITKIHDGDYITPDDGDLDAMERIRAAAEQPFDGREGLHVLVGGVPNATGRGVNRILCWARGDRYGVIEAWDTVEAAKSERGAVMARFFTELKRNR
jgi:hypothetical protein